MGVEEMHPAGAATWVVVGLLSGKLDGWRPGHFRGVTTIISSSGYPVHGSPAAGWFSETNDRHPDARLVCAPEEPSAPTRSQA